VRVQSSHTFRVAGNGATDSELRMLSLSLQNIWTHCYRYRVLECPTCRLTLDDPGVASIAKHWRVLGPYAHPRVRRLWSGLERGDVGRCGECVGSCVVGKGTQLPLCFYPSVVIVYMISATKSNSGRFWPWALWRIFFNKAVSLWRCRSYRQPGVFKFLPTPVWFSSCLCGRFS
jgi:hypothetical protein